MSHFGALAAGFSEMPTSRSFEDVPRYSTCWVYGEPMASRGIIGGYPCGGAPDAPGEPPGNLPYFRPNNNVPQAQTAKIVTNSFFPASRRPPRP